MVLITSSSMLLMVTAVVEIRTTQLGAIRVRKKDSFPRLLLCFFVFFCMNAGKRSEYFTNQILMSTTSICSELKRVDSCPHSLTEQQQADMTCSPSSNTHTCGIVHF